ncbi:hypothetical protein [Methanorbis rubei]|uniref:hypothetical protein n=1 Tax=Methanorbis rubei TaxID=3028300 RepID=UPI0030B8A1ED
MDQTTILTAAVGTASQCLSLHSLGTVVQTCPCETSLRHHLSKLSLFSLESLNHWILFHSCSLLLIPGRKYQFAIDLTNDPYYGKIDEQNKDYIILGQKKKSTKKFYTYVSLYSMVRGERVTFAVFPVKVGEKTVDLVKKCIQVLREHFLKVEVLCLDRGFYAVDVFSYLQSEQIPYIVPVKKQSKQMVALLNREVPGFTPYSIGKRKKRVETIIAIDVRRGRVD